MEVVSCERLIRDYKLNRIDRGHLVAMSETSSPEQLQELNTALSDIIAFDLQAGGNVAELLTIADRIEDRTKSSSRTTSYISAICHGDRATITSSITKYIQRLLVVESPADVLPFTDFIVNKAPDIANEITSQCNDQQLALVVKCVRKMASVGVLSVYLANVGTVNWRLADILSKVYDVDTELRIGTAFGFLHKDVELCRKRLEYLKQNDV